MSKAFDLGFDSDLDCFLLAAPCGEVLRTPADLDREISSGTHPVLDRKPFAPAPYLFLRSIGFSHL